MGEWVDLSGQTEVTGTSPGLRGYVARPASPGPWPGVVMVHELWGVDDVARRQADRLAEAGYLTVLPDLFSAGGAIRCLKATFAALKAQRGRAFQDIEAVPDVADRAAGLHRSGGGHRVLHGRRVRAAGRDARVRRQLGQLRHAAGRAGRRARRRLPGGGELRRQGPRAQGRGGHPRVDA